MSSPDAHNSVSIRLAEPAVFIRNNDRHRRQDQTHFVPDSRPSVLRGLLSVHFVKPTRVTSIQVDLSAKTRSAWPEGLGARRVEVTEEHKVYSDTIVFFKAGVPTRRNASVGPGLSIPHDEDVEFMPRNNASSRPSLSIQTSTSSSHSNPPQRSESSQLSSTVRPPRRISDGLGPSPTDSPPTMFNIPATPPMYTPTDVLPERPVLSRASSSTRSDNPAHALEDFRNALKADLLTSSPHLHGSTASSPSLYTFRESSLSRRPSIEDVPEDDLPAQFQTTPPVHPSPEPSPVPENARNLSPQHSPTPERRGRLHQRFSFASAILDVVRPHSPTRKERSNDRDTSRSGRSRTRDASHSRQPSTEKGKQVEHRSTLGRLGDILKFDLDPHDHHHQPSKEVEEHEESCDKWKVFKKGTYTFPISFTIPGDSPPTLQCPFGSVTWRIKAAVHRPGAFKAKLSASREVSVVAYPTEDTTEDSENIIIERQWDNQLQYLIAISGKSFHVGGKIPISLTLMPLTKMRIHRISVLLEERIDYYTMMKRIARTDPVTRTLLLSLKGDGSKPVLPLISDNLVAFEDSPFSSVSPIDSTMSKSEFVASLMGPGPWAFQHTLELNADCDHMHFSNKNMKSNMTVTHALKIVMRVDRGDDDHIDPKTGKRKMFDIVVQAPVHILSCRCNPEWMSLPRYSESLQQGTLLNASERCPCEDRERTSSGASRLARRADSFSSASTAETSVVHPGASLRLQQSLLDQNTQFERLVSGQETESGEVPPSYDTVFRSPMVAGHS